jgi:hypothetical protein
MPKLDVVSLITVVSQCVVLTSGIGVWVNGSLTIGVEVKLWAVAIEVYIVSENIEVSTKMVVSHSVIVSSNITVEILVVCPIIVNCSRADVASEVLS